MSKIVCIVKMYAGRSCNYFYFHVGKKCGYTKCTAHGARPIISTHCDIVIVLMGGIFGVFPQVVFYIFPNQCNHVTLGVDNERKSRK